MQGECAGLRVKSHTLEANRETVIVSMVDRGAYGQIEDFKGDITVEALPRCHLSEGMQRIIAIGLAAKEVESWLEVDEWDVMQVGNLWVLKPKSWDEKVTKRETR
jgi:hypothetical protein